MTATERPADLAAVEDLVAVMDRLRSPGGCPWDAAQTHASLLPFAVEEVYEVVEAVEHGDRAGLREELGDLLLQVVFHARVAQEHETEPFGLAEVAAGVAAKLRHRHPHVFGDAVVADAEDVHRRWEEIKKAEKARASVLDGVPAGLPALARAQKVVGRARRAGRPLDGVVAAGLAAGLAAAEELVAVGPSSDGTPETAIGARLLALVGQAQAAGVDAETALRAAVGDLEAAVRRAELAAGSGAAGPFGPEPTDDPGAGTRD